MAEHDFSDDDKQKILGTTAGKKPRAKVFFGQPLFWVERKGPNLWEDLFDDIDASVVVDCTPGSGSAARAALLSDVDYIGLAMLMLIYPIVHANAKNTYAHTHTTQAHDTHANKRRRTH